MTMEMTMGNGKKVKRSHVTVTEVDVTEVLMQMTPEQRDAVLDAAGDGMKSIKYGSLAQTDVSVDLVVRGEQEVDGVPVDQLTVVYRLFRFGSAVPGVWQVVRAQALVADPARPGAAMVGAEWNDTNHATIPEWVEELVAANLPQMLRVGDLSMVNPTALAELIEMAEQVAEV